MNKPPRTEHLANVAAYLRDRAWRALRATSKFEDQMVAADRWLIAKGKAEASQDRFESGLRSRLA